LAYDRHWNLVSANRMVPPLLEGHPAAAARAALQHPAAGLSSGSAGAAHGQSRPNGAGISWSGCTASARRPLDPELIKLYT